MDDYNPEEKGFEQLADDGEGDSTPMSTAMTDRSKFTTMTEADRIDLFEK